jgi:polyhydroxyalkanoate synthesis regulator phasin
LPTAASKLLADLPAACYLTGMSTTSSHAAKNVGSSQKRAIDWISILLLIGLTGLLFSILRLFIPGLYELSFNNILITVLGFSLVIVVILWSADFFTPGVDREAFEALKADVRDTLQRSRELTEGTVHPLAEDQTRDISKLRAEYETHKVGHIYKSDINDIHRSINTVETMVRGVNLSLEKRITEEKENTHHQLIDLEAQITKATEQLVNEAKHTYKQVAENTKNFRTQYDAHLKDIEQRIADTYRPMLIDQRKEMAETRNHVHALEERINELMEQQQTVITRASFLSPENAEPTNPALDKSRLAFRYIPPDIKAALKAATKELEMSQDQIAIHALRAWLSVNKYLPLTDESCADPLDESAKQEV